MCTKFEAKLWKFLRLLTTNQIAAVMFQNIPHTKAFLTLYQKRYARLWESAVCKRLKVIHLLFTHKCLPK